MQTERSREARVLSLGAVAMDVVLASSGLPEDDGFSLVADEVLVPGGSASNVSVALHRLGVPVWQTGKIGDDHYGVLFREDLIRNGIHVEPLAVKPGGTTLHTYIITAPGGKHCIFANKGDCVFDLRPEELAGDVLDGFTCFYNDLFSPLAALWLADQARERGIPVVYNMQCAPSFMESCGVSRDQIQEMLSKAALVIGGADGFGEIVEASCPEEAARAVYQRFQPSDGVICTCGAQGAVWYGPEGLTRSPAFPVAAVDSTGAGDTFCAGLIFARFCCGEENRGTALRFASAAAALKCTVPGPRSTANLEAVIDFLRRNETDG